MTESHAAGGASVPGHLWLVGVLATLWNAMGAFGHWATVTGNEAALADQPPELLEYFEAMPTWAVAAWGIAVYGGVLGSLLMLLRKRLAGLVLLLSFVSMLATNAYQYGKTSPCLNAFSSCFSPSAPACR